MKKPVVFVLALLVGVSTSLFAAEAKKAAGPDFKDMMQKTIAAWETMDPAKAAPFYATDEKDLAFFDIEPLKYTGWTEYADGTKKVLADFASLKASIYPDARVELKGNVAWATATVHFEATMKKDGSKMAFDGRWTLIWEKKGDKWLIVHEHTSSPLAPPCPPAPPAPKGPPEK